MKTPETPGARIHAFIICWSGHEEHARQIAGALESSVDFLTVIYSNPSEQPETGAGEWIRVSDDWFYGRKCAETLRLHAGDIMLHVTADAKSDDWPQLVRRCRSIHEQYDDLGIWAPDIEYTDYLTETVRIASLGDPRLLLVSQTDSIVWSMSAPVVRRLRELDYECNNLGWGIDWFAISHATANNLLVIRDMAVKIIHPRGTGYSDAHAISQMQEFLAQMTPQEKVQFALLDAFNHKERQPDFIESLRMRIKSITRPGRSDR